MKNNFIHTNMYDTLNFTKKIVTDSTGFSICILKQDSENKRKE